MRWAPFTRVLSGRTGDDFLRRAYAARVPLFFGDLDSHGLYTQVSRLVKGNCLNLFCHLLPDLDFMRFYGDVVSPCLFRSLYSVSTRNACTCTFANDDTCILKVTIIFHFYLLWEGDRQEQEVIGARSKQRAS